MSPAVWRSRPVAAVSRWRRGCSPVSAAGASGGARGVGEAGSAGGGGQHVAEWGYPSFGRECEQVGSKSWPGGFVGEPGDVLVGLVELCHVLGSGELFGCDMEAVVVALDRLGKLGRWVV